MKTLEKHNIKATYQRLKKEIIEYKEIEKSVNDKANKLYNTGIMNLKLYKLLTENVNMNAFYKFCEIEYNFFKDYINELPILIDKMGRTSLIEIKNSSDQSEGLLFKNHEYKLNIFWYDEDNISIGNFEYNFYENIPTYKELMKSAKEVKYSQADLYHYLEKISYQDKIDLSNDILKVLDYLDDFGSNQVENFNEFLKEYNNQVKTLELNISIKGLDEQSIQATLESIYEQIKSNIGYGNKHSGFDSCDDETYSYNLTLDK